MKHILIGLALMISLTACASTSSPEAQIWVACRSFIDTEQALRPFKSRMTAGQIAAISEAVSIAAPICVGGSGGSTDLKTALDAVRAQLARLIQIQNEGVR